MTPRLWTRAELLQAGLGSLLLGLTLTLLFGWRALPLATLSCGLALAPLVLWGCWREDSPDPWRATAWLSAEVVGAVSLVSCCALQGIYLNGLWDQGPAAGWQAVGETLGRLVSRASQLGPLLSALGAALALGAAWDRRHLPFLEAFAAAYLGILVSCGLIFAFGALSGIAAEGAPPLRPRLLVFALALAPLVAGLAFIVRGILRAARVAASLGRERAAVQEEPLAP